MDLSDLLGWESPLGKYGLMKMARNDHVTLVNRKLGDQVSGRKPGIIFQSPEFEKKKKTNVLIFMGIFTNFDKYMSQKSAFHQKLCFIYRQRKDVFDYCWFLGIKGKF